ncbi:unnamed protein product [Leptosia nina]|uniref:Uncharacterized protein n=1 Tax=Leptosia nina TaxID=320188 RepID=A0AAV1K085_9NEOP
MRVLLCCLSIACFAAQTLSLRDVDTTEAQIAKHQENIRSWQTTIADLFVEYAQFKPKYLEAKNDQIKLLKIINYILEENINIFKNVITMLAQDAQETNTDRPLVGSGNNATYTDKGRPVNGPGKDAPDTDTERPDDVAGNSASYTDKVRPVNGSGKYAQDNTERPAVSLTMRTNEDFLDSDNWTRQWIEQIAKSKNLTPV